MKKTILLAATIIALTSVKAQQPPRPQPPQIQAQDIRDIDSLNFAGVPANALVIQGYNVAGKTVTISSFLGYKVANRGDKISLELIARYFCIARHSYSW